MIPPDDPNILITDILLRRLHPTWIHERKNGEVYITSAAFWQDGPVGEISVNVERMTTHQRVLALGKPEDSLASTSAAFPRSLGYVAALVPEAGNPGHAHLYPPADFGRKAREKKGKMIARQATIVVLNSTPIKDSD